MDFTTENYQTFAMVGLLPQVRDEKSKDEILLSHFILGMCGEAGEVANLAKKKVFHRKDIKVEDFADELGDVLWYIANICNCLGIRMTDVMNQNIKKLEERYPKQYGKR